MVHRREISAADGLSGLSSGKFATCRARAPGKNSTAKNIFSRTRCSRIGSPITRSVQRLFILILIFFGDIVLRNFVSMNLFFIGIPGIFHSGDDSGLERVPFLDEFVDAFGIHAFDVRETLQIAGLHGRLRFHLTDLKHLRICFPGCGPSFFFGTLFFTAAFFAVGFFFANFLGAFALSPLSSWAQPSFLVPAFWRLVFRLRGTLPGGLFGFLFRSHSRSLAPSHVQLQLRRKKG